MRDKHGKPVGGLKKSDFTVLDDKRPQHIEFFSGEVNSAQARDVNAKGQPSMPLNTFTNKAGANDTELKNVTVILLDALNTPLLDQSYARDQVIKFLQQIQPADHIAIYTLGRHLRMMHDFSTDSASLVAMLQKYKGRPTTELETSKEWNDSPLQTMLLPREAIDAAQQSFGDRINITGQAFMDIVNHLASVPGRKNLIWVSGAFPLVIGLEEGRKIDEYPVSFADEVDQVTKVLNNANLAVYPVDARGIVGADIAGPGTYAGIPSGHGDTWGQMTMSFVASMTGGRAYFNTNDIKGSIREAINDASVTYELTYVPHEILWNGRYHKIKVEVNIPRAKVRAREGYFATPLPGANERSSREIIGSIATSPLEATGIQLSSRVMAIDEKARQIAVVTSVDLHQILFQTVNGKFSGRIQAVLAQVDDRNAIVDADSKTLAFEVVPELFQPLLAKGGTYSKEITLDPRAVSLRIVIRDADTGNIGSVNIPLDDYFPRKKPKS